MGEKSPQSGQFGSIAAHAAELLELVDAYSAWRERDKDVSGFSTRVVQLRQLVEEAERLATAVSIVTTQFQIRIEGRAAVVELQKRVFAFAKRIKGDSSQLLKQRAIDDLKVLGALQAVHQKALTEWRRTVLEGIQGAGLDSVLSRYKRFRTAGEQITRIRGRLEELAKHLPTDAEQVRTVGELHEQLNRAVLTLADEGLDEDVVEFLRQAGTSGVPLKDLLLLPAVLSWLEQEGLTASFVVHPL